MTPQEFDFMCNMLQAAAEAGYGLGAADSKLGNSLKSGAFVLDAGRRLIIKKELNKLKKKR